MPESMSIEGPAKAGHYIGPRIAAWVLSALTAVALAGRVYRGADSGLRLARGDRAVIPMPSAAAAFVDGLHNSPTMLRPLKDVRTRLLVQAGEALGGRHHLVFAGITRWPGAVQEHATDIAAYVAARFPPPVSCDGVQLPW